MVETSVPSPSTLHSAVTLIQTSKFQVALNLELTGICEDIRLYLRRFRDAKVHYPARRERAKEFAERSGVMQQLWSDRELFTRCAESYVR